MQNPSDSPQEQGLHNEKEETGKGGGQSAWWERPACWWQEEVVVLWRLEDLTELSETSGPGVKKGKRES